MQQDASPLPQGWGQAQDPSTGNVYYYNLSTGQTTWERPKATEAAAAPAQSPVQNFGVAQNAMAGFQGVAGAYGAGTQDALAAQQSMLNSLGYANLQAAAGYPQANAMAGGFANAGNASAGGGQMKSGIVKSWTDDKGFGFVTPDGSTEDIFVHRTRLEDGQMLERGMRVQFESEWNPQKNRYHITRLTGAIAKGSGKGQDGGGSAPAPADGSMSTGTVKSWYTEKGFGFIMPQGGGEDVFVHKNALADGGMLVPGASVTYTMEWNQQKGKYTTSKCYGAAPAQGGGGSDWNSGGGGGDSWGKSSWDNNSNQGNDRYGQYGGGNKDWNSGGGGGGDSYGKASWDNGANQGSDRYSPYGGGGGATPGGGCGGATEAAAMMDQLQQQMQQQQQLQQQMQQQPQEQQQQSYQQQLYEQQQYQQQQQQQEQPQQQQASPSQ